jgi:hypothetical protein
VVPVAVGEVSFWVEVAEGEGVHVAVSSELKLDGITVGGRTVLPRPLVKKIHPIPRIETILITIGIRSARSNEGRGCIPDEVLPRFYPHLFRYRVPPSDNYLNLNFEV